MSFSFDQFLESESNTIEEDWGVGQFNLIDIDFEMTMKPKISNNNLRLNIVDDKLTFGDYKYVLRTKENSQFEKTLGRFSSVFSEHMRKQVVPELSQRFAQAIQKASYSFFRRLQQNNKVSDTGIYMNKHVSLICFVPGQQILQEDPSTGEMVVKGRESGSVGLEFQGGFSRLQDLLSRGSAKQD